MTEIDYFRQVKSHTRARNVTVKPAPEGKGSAKRLYKEALRAVKDKGDFDEVFIVVDVDDYTDLHEIAGKCSRQAAIHLAVSNPSFDVWLRALLTPNFAASLPSAEHQRYLEKKGILGGRNNKSIVNFPNDLVGEKVASHLRADLDSVPENPGSAVHHLVAMMSTEGKTNAKR